MKENFHFLTPDTHATDRSIGSSSVGGHRALAFQTISPVANTMSEARSFLE